MTLLSSHYQMLFVLAIVDTGLFVLLLFEEISFPMVTE